MDGFGYVPWIWKKPFSFGKNGSYTSYYMYYMWLRVCKTCSMYVVFYPWQHFDENCIPTSLSHKIHYRKKQVIMIQRRNFFFVAETFFHPLKGLQTLYISLKIKDYYQNNFPHSNLENVGSTTYSYINKTQVLCKQIGLRVLSAKSLNFPKRNIWSAIHYIPKWAQCSPQISVNIKEYLKELAVPSL